MVRTSAITIPHTLALIPTLIHSTLAPSGELTNKRQPNKLKTRERNDRQQYPQHRLRIQRDPEKPSIRRVDGAGLGVRGLEYPATVAGRAVDFVPPPQSDEAASGDVFEVVEIGCEEEDCDYEDEDAGGGRLADGNYGVQLGGTWSVDV